MSNRNNTRPAVSSARHTLRALIPALLLGATSLVGACSDAVMAPAESSALQPKVTVNRAVGTLATPASVQALLRSRPIAQPIVVRKWVTPAGGTIEVPGADFELEVPRGAFYGPPMLVTVTAYAGNAVAYDFQPHGTTFLKPLTATQRLDRTTWKDLRLPAGFSQSAAGAYFADPTQVNLLTGSAKVDEMMSTRMSVRGSELSWDVPHFSGYIVSWGIQDCDPQQQSC